MIIKILHFENSKFSLKGGLTHQSSIFLPPGVCAMQLVADSRKMKQLYFFITFSYFLEVSDNLWCEALSLVVANWQKMSFFRGVFFFDFKVSQLFAVSNWTEFERRVWRLVSKLSPCQVVRSTLLSSSKLAKDVIFWGGVFFLASKCHNFFQ